MADNPTSLANFYAGWQNYQQLLTTVLAPLSPEQLALQAAPHLRSIGQIATHIIGARVRWFHDLMGQASVDVASLATWDRPEMSVRTATELVSGLEASWQLIQNALAAWTAADLEYLYHGRYHGQEYTFSRQWVIWHVIEHDLHHGGEISLSLGMHGLTAPDL